MHANTTPSLVQSSPFALQKGLLPSPRFLSPGRLAIQSKLCGFWTLTCEIPRFEYRKVPFQGARFQNSVVPHFVESVAGRAKARTEDNIVSDRGVFEP